MAFGKLGAGGRGFGREGSTVLGSLSTSFRALMRMEIPNITFPVGNQTYYLRQECEAPFDAIRIRVWNTISSPTGVFSFVAASTETALRDTAAHRFRPIVGGTEYNSVVTSGPGWRVGLWGGSAVSGSAGAGNAVATSVESDWLNVSSVNRDDGSLRHLLLLRLYANGNASGANYSGTQIVGDRNDIDYSRVYDMGVFNGDGVSTLTNEPANYFRSSASALSPLMSIEFRYRGNVVATSFMNGGDSVSGGVQSSGTQTGDGQDGWQQRAILGASTPDAPMTFMNVGQSGQTSSTFMPALTSVLNSGVRPNYIFIPTGSRNDGYGDNGKADTYFTRVDALIALCATLSPKPKIVMWNDVPLYNATHGGDATVDATQAYALTLAQARLAAGSIDAIVNTYDAVKIGSPAVWDTSDNLHPASGSVEPTRPATPLMASTFRSYLRPTFGPIIMRPASYFAGFSFAQVGSNCVVRNPQVSGSGTIGYSYQWKLDGTNVGTNSTISPTWASGDIGKVPTCVVTVTGDGPSVQSTATFPAVVAAATNFNTTSNTLSGYVSPADLTFAQNATDPFGNANTAWTVTEGTANATHSALNTNLITFTLNEVWTTSMYVKVPSGGRSAFQIAFDSNRFGATAYANFDISGGTGGSVGAGGAGATAKIWPCEEVPGWYRCEATATCTSSGTGRSAFKMSNTPNGGRLAAYTGTGLTQIWYNGQLNKASTAQANVVT